MARDIEVLALNCYNMSYKCFTSFIFATIVCLARAGATDVSLEKFVESVESDKWLESSAAQKAVLPEALGSWKGLHDTNLYPYMGVAHRMIYELGETKLKDALFGEIFAHMGDGSSMTLVLICLTEDDKIAINACFYSPSCCSFTGNVWKKEQWAKIPELAAFIGYPAKVKAAKDNDRVRSIAPDANYPELRDAYARIHYYMDGKVESQTFFHIKEMTAPDAKKFGPMFEQLSSFVRFGTWEERFKMDLNAR